VGFLDSPPILFGMNRVAYSRQEVEEMLALGPAASLALLRREGVKIGGRWRMSAHHLAGLLARSPSEMAPLLADLGVGPSQDRAQGATGEADRADRQAEEE